MKLTCETENWERKTKKSCPSDVPDLIRKLDCAAAAKVATLEGEEAKN
jgi:hypothetical protein